MNKKQYSTSKAPGAPKFLSQAIESGGFIFVSGQIHMNTDGKLIESSTADKVEQTMANISNILVAANSTLKDIVKVVIYVTDMSQMPEINEVYPAFFSEPFPVREAICVSELPLGATIEISVVAAR